MAEFLNRPRKGYALEIAVTDISDVNSHPDAFPIIRLLLEHGADPFKQSKNNPSCTVYLKMRKARMYVRYFPAWMAWTSRIATRVEIRCFWQLTSTRNEDG